MIAPVATSATPGYRASVASAAATAAPTNSRGERVSTQAESDQNVSTTSSTNVGSDSAIEYSASAWPVNAISSAPAHAGNARPVALRRSCQLTAAVAAYTAV